MIPKLIIKKLPTIIWRSMTVVNPLTALPVIFRKSVCRPSRRPNKKKAIPANVVKLSSKDENAVTAEIARRVRCIKDHLDRPPTRSDTSNDICICSKLYKFVFSSFEQDHSVMSTCRDMNSI